MLKLKYPNNFDKTIPMLNIGLKYFDYQKKNTVETNKKELVKPDFIDPLLKANYCRLTFVDNVHEANMKGR